MLQYNKSIERDRKGGGETATNVMDYGCDIVSIRNHTVICPIRSAVIHSEYH